MDRSSRQKINKATETVNDITENLDLIDIFRKLHPKKTQNIHSFQQTTMNHTKIYGMLQNQFLEESSQ